ncbi:MAG: alkaline phosphatase D family protein [Ignavibacteriaceae bacterium]
MKKTYLIYLILIVILTSMGCEKKSSYQGQEMGEFAPEDAYLEGSEHPFYGSENAWDQRFYTRHPAKYYKRRGQKAMLMLMKDQANEAEKYCRELIADDKNDLEAYYNLTAALAKQNKINEAMDTLRVAISKGLPFGRFLAGPRSILHPLTSSKEFNHYASNFHEAVIHGPMVGRVTDHSASFWVRTYEQVKIQVMVSGNEDLSNSIKSSEVFTDSAKDYTGIVTVNKLKPSTKYYYQIYVNDKLDGASKTFSFMTYPELNQSGNFEVAFGGCAGYVYWHEKIWKVIKEHNPIAFLWLGDNVYINMPNYPNAMHDYTYYRRQSRPEFRNLVSSTANYAVWDDHDAATDDVWLGPFKDKPGWKMPLLVKFEENWINPFYGTNDWPATYFNFAIGDVEFFMTDGRFYRTNPYDKNPSMLGPAQKEWLLDALKKSKATFKVIVSGVPWAFDAKADSKDTWNGFKEERKEIFDFLADNKINGVLLLSGDRHRTDIRKIERPNGYTLYDFENCKLTNQHTAPLEHNAIFEYNEENCFGILQFESGLEDPKVTYEPYNIDNKRLYSMSLTLSQLSD